MQTGDTEIGVSVAYTVRAMDAGPVLAAERVAVDPDVQAPEVLAGLFQRGSRQVQDSENTRKSKVY